MEGISNSFAALNFGEDVSDSEISIPSPLPSPVKKGKAAKAKLPSVEDAPAKPKAQARPSSRKEDRAYGSIVASKVWREKGADSTPSEGQLVKGPSQNNGRGAQQQQQPRGAHPEQQKQYRDNGNQQVNNGRVYQQHRDNGNQQVNNGRVYQQHRDNGNQQVNNGRVYPQHRDNGNQQVNNGRVYQQHGNNGRVYQQQRPKGNYQNTYRRDNGSGYQQRNGAQEKEVIVDEEGWTHVKPKVSNGDLSRSSSRPESRESRPANVDSKDSVEDVPAPAVATSEDVKEASAPAVAATEAPKEALPLDPKKRKEERERRREEAKRAEEEEKQRELESKQITLKEYEKRQMEKRQTLEASRAEARRVVADKDLQKLFVGKKKKQEEETLKVDLFGREVTISEEEEKAKRVEKAEKKKLQKEDPEKADLLKQVTLGMCRYARPPVQRPQGRRDGFDQQQGGVQDGREVQQGSRGGGGGFQGSRHGGAPSVPKPEDFQAFPDLSAAAAKK